MDCRLWTVDCGLWAVDCGMFSDRHVIRHDLLYIYSFREDTRYRAIILSLENLNVIIRAIN